MVLTRHAHVSDQGDEGQGGRVVPGLGKPISPAGARAKGQGQVQGATWERHHSALGVTGTVCGLCFFCISVPVSGNCHQVLFCNTYIVKGIKR